MTNRALDRYKGCLMGLAVGDALGTTLEFKAPGSFQPVTTITGGGPFGLKPGEWTDDTSMALCLAKSLIDMKGFDARDQVARYCQWAGSGYMSSTGVCFDIGMTVSSALRRFQINGEPFAGTTNPNMAGNGSLMRLAPVPMFYGHEWSSAEHFAEQSSRTTHGATTCLDACRYFAGLVWGALNGVDKDILLSARYSPAGDFWEKRPLCPEISAIAEGSFKRKSPPDIRGTGYVVDCLEAALWAFHNSSDFRNGCLKAVNLGNDADTTGAVYGQLAGAFYGHSGIPDHWSSLIKYREMLLETASDLARAAGVEA